MAEPVKQSTRSRQAAGADDDAARLREQIEQRAYQLWEEHGRPQGRDDEHWQQAEREVRQAQGKPDKPSPASPSRRSAATDPTGAAAPPARAKQPGASAERGGTPSAAATGPGRGAGTGSRKTR